MTTAELVRYDITNGIATITMDDGKANVMSLAMIEALFAAFDRAQSDKAVVVLTGRERTFSAGYDLKLFSSPREEIVKTIKRGGELVERILGFPFPVVTACGGNAIAQGSFLMLAADVRFGSLGEFKVGANEVAIGLTIPHYAVEVTRERLNGSWFHHATLTGMLYTPEQALTAGFFDHLVPHGTVLQAAQGAAEMLTKINMAAHAGTKARVRGPVLERIRAGMVKEFGE